MELIDIYDINRVRTGETIPREGAFLKEGQYMLYALAIIEDEQGRYLITQRSQDKHWAAGAWEVTGGGVLSGETPRDAIVREIGEEVGLDVSGLDVEPVYSYENVDLKHGDNYFCYIFHFRFGFSEGDVTLQQSEAVDFKLATAAEIAQLNEQGLFLHYERICQALANESLQ